MKSIYLIYILMLLYHGFAQKTQQRGSGTCDLSAVQNQIQKQAEAIESMESLQRNMANQLGDISQKQAEADSQLGDISQKLGSGLSPQPTVSTTNPSCTNFSNGICFYLSDIKANWEGAAYACSDKYRGNLVELDDIWKLDYVNNMAATMGNIWVGGTIVGNSRTFVWYKSVKRIVMGGPTSLWYITEPGDTTYCVLISGTNLKLHDNPCTNSFFYVCEKQIGM